MLFILCLVITVSMAYSSEKKREYKIQKKDLLGITIYPQTELNTEAEVDKNGDIFFSFLGKIHAENLTVDMFAEKLRSILEKDYLIDPKYNSCPEYFILQIVVEITTMDDEEIWDLFEKKIGNPWHSKFR